MRKRSDDRWVTSNDAEKRIFRFSFQRFVTAYVRFYAIRARLDVASRSSVVIAGVDFPVFAAVRWRIFGSALI